MDQSNYQSVYDNLASTYQPQADILQTQVNQLPQQQQAQQSALDQAKVNAFKDITNQANSRGVVFSGVPIDQQATYTGTKYLPAVANLQTSFNNQKNSLLGQINSLNMQRQKEASDTVSQYQKNQADAAYKNAQLQLGYARLGASKGAAAAKPLTQQQITGAIQTGLQHVTGKDGYVSPQDYAQGLAAWLQAGLPRASYNKQFSSYRNPKNGYYDYAVKNAGL